MISLKPKVLKLQPRTIVDLFYFIPPQNSIMASNCTTGHLDTSDQDIHNEYANIQAFL